MSYNPDMVSAIARATIQERLRDAETRARYRAPRLRRRHRRTSMR
jgi:hypothetical protein